MPAIAIASSGDNGKLLLLSSDGLTVCVGDWSRTDRIAQRAMSRGRLKAVKFEIYSVTHQKDPMTIRSAKPFLEVLIWTADFPRLDSFLTP